MENVNQAKQNLFISDVLMQALSLYKKNFLLFIGIVFIGNVFGFSVGALGRFIFNLFKIKVGLIFMSITALVSASVWIWASIAFIIAVSARYLNMRITLQECFRNVKGRYWKFIGVKTIYYAVLLAIISLMVITGIYWRAMLLLAFLLMFPAIYWGTIFSLAGVIVVLEKTRLIKSFKLSKDLIGAWFLKVFAIGFILAILTTLLYSILSRILIINKNLWIIAPIVYFFCLSFLTVVDVVLYYRLKEIKESEGGSQ